MKEIFLKRRHHTVISLLFFFTVSLFSVLSSSSAALANSIKVLIVNDAYPNIPSKNEKIERLGSMQGELLVMGSRYAGDIDVWKGENGLYIVNEVPIEEYIRGVVAVEVSPEWDMEALKAQAVISRTYALYQKSMNGNSLYHLASSVLHQVYKGKKTDERVASAVSATAGEVLTYEGNIIESFYHSTSCGRTESPEEVFSKQYPYLKSLEANCELSPYALWERIISVDEIEKATGIPDIREIAIASYTTANRVKQLKLTTDAGDTLIAATDLRKSLGWSRLPSTDFTLRRTDNEFIFLGSGYGHGVGLCQWCMLKMAREGAKYSDILSFFYPGTSIQAYVNR